MSAGVLLCFMFVFLFQAEDGIRDLVRSRGLGDVYKRQGIDVEPWQLAPADRTIRQRLGIPGDAIVIVCVGLSLIHI